MNENDRHDQELIGKNVAFYETFLNAWVENRMEIDKQLLTLSSLAIGFLMFFYNKLHNTTELVLWLIAGSLFVTTIIAVLCIFRCNSKYIEYIIRNDDQIKKSDSEKRLQMLTQLAFIFFILGIIISFILAIYKSGFVILKV